MRQRYETAIDFDGWAQDLSPGRAAQMAAAMELSGSTWQAAPRSMAILGIPKTTELASSCAMVWAPADLIFFNPCAPSEPIPVRITPMALRSRGLGDGGEQHVYRRALIADHRTVFYGNAESSAVLCGEPCGNCRVRSGPSLTEPDLHPPPRPRAWGRICSCARQMRAKNRQGCAA